MQSARTKSEAGILVLVVFILGLLVGVVGNHLWGTRVWSSSSAPQHPNGRPPGQSMAQRLQLTPDQQKQMDAIRDDMRTQFQTEDAKHNETIMQFRARIRAILTSDQQVKFDAMMKENDSHGRGRGPGPQPGGGPGPHPGPGF
jgi:Spy/CpxP family protein refolding chaperone